MVRPILRYGDQVLHRRADPVAAITPEIGPLIDDMVETLHDAKGIGLAAPQIGVSQRIFVIDLSVGRVPSELIVLINPEFIQRDGLQLVEEGCLSVPGIHATVARPAAVTIRGVDRHGTPRTIEGQGLLARAVQHEMDHLNGILFLDRLRPVQRFLLTRRARAQFRRPALAQ